MQGTIRTIRIQSDRLGQNRNQTNKQLPQVQRSK